VSNADTIRTAVDAMNRGDLDTYALIFAEGARRWTAGVGETGVQESLDEMRGLSVGFADFHLDTDALIDGGDYVVARWRARGTHTGEFMGLAPTGRAVEVQGATFSEFDADGLVVRDTHYIDLGALLGQLGLT
jgi:predicted ester cyclase